MPYSAVRNFPIPDQRAWGLPNPRHNTGMHRSATTRKESNIRRNQIQAKPSCGQAAQNGGPASGVNGSWRRNKQKAFTFVPPKAGHSFCIISSRETERAEALFWAAFFGPFLFGKRKGRKKVFVARIFKIYPRHATLSTNFPIFTPPETIMKTDK